MSTDPRLARPEWRGRTNVDALTIACIEHAEQIALLRTPQLAHQFVVTQGSYQAGHGDPKSAGTHDLGGVVDLRWCGHVTCIRALREAGFAAWHRTPPQGDWPDHIHAVVIGHPMLANVAEEQVDDYLIGRNGLAHSGLDDGPRLSPIPRPVWPWPPTKKRPAAVRAAIKAAELAIAAIEAALAKSPGPVQTDRLTRALAKQRDALARLREVQKR